MTKCRACHHGMQLLSESANPQNRDRDRGEGATEIRKQKQQERTDSVPHLVARHFGEVKRSDQWEVV